MVISGHPQECTYLELGDWPVVVLNSLNILLLWLKQPPANAVTQIWCFGQSQMALSMVGSEPSFSQLPQAGFEIV